MNVSQKITVIIPNFNGAHLLIKNLPSVIAAVENYGHDSIITVVDDGSSDKSLETLRNSFPVINVIEHEQNMGFAEAVHTGVKHAQTELVFILNSDVQLEEHFFAALTPYFDDEKTFSVNPLIYGEDGDVKRHSWNYRQFRKGRISLLPWNLDEVRKSKSEAKQCLTMYAHGGSMLVRKNMFDTLGGFDPIFKPYYGEDSDLGLRAWRNGWYSYFEPNVSLVHQSVGSIKENAKIKKVKCIRRRNRYLLEWIHLTPWQLISKTLPVSIFQLIGELITFNGVNVKGFLLALLKLPEVFKSRKAIKSQAKLSVNQVFELLAKKFV